MKKAKPLKVYGWSDMRGGVQTREVVAAASHAAARLADIPRGQAREWIAQTWNDEEVRVATAAPGVVHWQPLDSHDGEWKRVAKRAQHGQ